MPHLFEATLTESTPERRFPRTVTLEDAIGVGSGPQTERTALLVRAFETQNDVIERYYGSWIAVAVAFVDERGRERLELAVAPDVRLEQDVEELLFRAYSLYRQVDLTFETGRDRALCLRMLYGVIAGLFKELDRNAATHAQGQPVESTRIEYLDAALDRAEGYFRRAAQRRAQMRYLGGVIGGLSVIAGVGFLLAIGLAMLPDLQDQSGM